MATLQHRILHLHKDRILKKVISSTSLARRKRDTDLYLALMRAVVGQQLSVKAAQTIWNRYLDLFDTRYPLAEAVIAMPIERLRSAGLSFQKASYIKNIAQFSLDSILDYKLLKKKSDEELISYLVAIKGVGRWTVEMILMFNLQREDIFPNDDLGIQNSMKALYAIVEPDRKKFLQKMDTIAAKWKPYRTLACMYLWASKDQK
jgi:DNA-3-methyladenine glycosylase II